MKESFKPLLVILLVLGLTTPGFAAGKKKKAAEYHDTVISSVAGNSVTITEDKVAKTFTVTQFTEITVKGQRANVADLQPGMAVSVTLGTDGVTPSRIAASDPPAHFEDTRKPVKTPAWVK